MATGIVEKSSEFKLVVRLHLNLKERMGGGDQHEKKMLRRIMKFYLFPTQYAGAADYIDYISA